jgi:hypothetical protein
MAGSALDGVKAAPSIPFLLKATLLNCLTKVVHYDVTVEEQFRLLETGHLRSIAGGLFWGAFITSSTASRTNWTWARDEIILVVCCPEQLVGSQCNKPERAISHVKEMDSFPISLVQLFGIREPGTQTVAEKRPKRIVIAARYCARSEQTARSRLADLPAQQSQGSRPRGVPLACCRAPRSCPQLARQPAAHACIQAPTFRSAPRELAAAWLPTPDRPSRSAGPPGPRPGPRPGPLRAGCGSIPPWGRRSGPAQAAAAARERHPTGAERGPAMPESRAGSPSGWLSLVSEWIV